jgi:hypothetical protein
LAIIDPKVRGSVRVTPLPEKPISVGDPAASRTALLNTHGHRMVLVDTVAARVLRFIPTRLVLDQMVVLPLPV